MVVAKELIVEDFFVLSRGLAGEILQKFINYGGRIAIYGDFSVYTSKPLQDLSAKATKAKTSSLSPPAKTQSPNRQNKSSAFACAESGFISYFCNLLLPWSAGRKKNIRKKKGYDTYCRRRCDKD